MNTYFATFPAGAFELIAKQLKSFKLDELKITEHDESSVIFSSSLRTEKLVELRYFTNVYLIIVAGQRPTAIQGRYYRLMLLKSGTPQQMDSKERAKIGTQIENDFGLRPNAHLSKNDFFVIERTSGKKMLTLNLSRTKREKQAAGELRPELANILCLAAGLKAKHTVLDMFAGYGSIPFEAVRGFGCTQVIAVDNQKLKSRHEHKFIKWYKANAQNLDFLTDESVDRIVTDPPWGIYDGSIGDQAAFYQNFINEAIRILRPDGIAVILTGYDKANEVFELKQELDVIGKWKILVSGKKAVIYKLQKRNKGKH